MADEEPLDSPTNMQSENSLNETIPTEQLETVNPIHSYHRKTYFYLHTG